MNEEVENGRDDMLVDGFEHEEKQGILVPEGFNANYLKVYYGNALSEILLGHMLGFLVLWLSLNSNSELFIFLSQDHLNFL